MTPARPTEDREPNSRRAGGVQVIDKAFELVEVLVGGEASAAELADRLEEPRATIYRLLTSLQTHGIVDPGVRRGTFRLGLGLVRLGGEVLAGLDVRTAARPAMTELHEQTGETVFLCIRSGETAVCVERLDGLHVQSLAMRLGGALPLHLGAAGMVLLAAESPAEWDRYLAANPVSPTTPRGRADGPAVRRALQQTRDRGHAVSDQDVTVGIAALGAPVFDHSGAVVAALSISGVRDLILGAEVRDANVTRVVTTAQQISGALGHVARPAGAP